MIPEFMITTQFYVNAKNTNVSHKNNTVIIQSILFLKESLFNVVFVCVYVFIGIFLSLLFLSYFNHVFIHFNLRKKKYSICFFKNKLKLLKEERNNLTCHLCYAVKSIECTIAQFFPSEFPSGEHIHNTQFS